MHHGYPSTFYSQAGKSSKIKKNQGYRGYQHNGQYWRFLLVILAHTLANFRPRFLHRLKIFFLLVFNNLKLSVWTRPPYIRIFQIGLRCLCVWVWAENCYIFSLSLEKPETRKPEEYWQKIDVSSRYAQCTDNEDSKQNIRMQFHMYSF